ncbi:hypothetical protein ASE04_05715 [Rhizobium sp. Root708]|uniref:DUF982 domain-containing protein n=1 Tax=Rhizobium sp. Root708 TaxID=1736592 RepID=UPI0006F2E15F|nr:DUF982 domain-containing protein [Rhizobium sp. Root708]KRB55204.1 hypothetical protein ASE04_05715 [Rhizobium sp. Root708]
MPIEKWQSPIKISTGNRSSETIGSPFEAVIYLTDSWPERSSVSFIEARNACRGALAGRIDPEVARAKFLAAVQAAKMQVN